MKFIKHVFFIDIYINYFESYAAIFTNLVIIVETLKRFRIYRIQRKKLRN